MSDAHKMLEAFEGLVTLPVKTDLMLEAGIIFDSSNRPAMVAGVDVFHDFEWTDEEAHAVASVISLAVNEWVERTRASAAHFRKGGLALGEHKRGEASKASDVHCEIAQGCGDTASSPRPEWRAQLIEHIDAISSLPGWPSKYPSARQLAAFVAGLQAGERSAARGVLATATPSLVPDAAKLDHAASRALYSAVRQARQTQLAALSDRGRN